MDVTTTPLSSATDTPNGYTSEETDYASATPPPPPYLSATTPTDEQMYQDMSFLQSADTSELVEVVADFCSTEDLTTLSPQQQRKFANKVIKGKVRFVCLYSQYGDVGDTIPFQLLTKVTGWCVLNGRRPSTVG